MEHKGTIRIETQRLVLRRHTLEDAESMFSNWASEKEVTKFLRWQPYKCVEDTKKMIAEWVASYSKPDFYFWTIELKEIRGEILEIIMDYLNHKVNYYFLNFLLYL